MSTSVERLAALQLAINHIGPTTYSLYVRPIDGQNEDAVANSLSKQVDQLILTVAKKFEAYIEGDPNRPVETTDATTRIETRNIVGVNDMRGALGLGEKSLCSRCGYEEHHITHVDNNPSFKHSFEVQERLDEQGCGRCGVSHKEHVAVNRDHVFEPRKS